MTTPQQLVEHALTSSTADDCIVLVHASSEANLRWANNTLTTNGAMRRLAVTVIAFAHRRDGVAAASVSGTAVDLPQVTALVASADAAAQQADVAEDARPLVSGEVCADWEMAPGETAIEVFGDFAPQLGDAFGQARSQGRILYGFVSHGVTTTYLGSSTGLRLRHEQPTGHYACTGKDSRLTTSAWVGGATRDFSDVDAIAMSDELTQRLTWARRRIELPAGRYDTILPPSAVADLMVDAYWSAGARVAHEGETLFSRPDGGTRIGDPIARSGVRLWSDPAHPLLGCSPFVEASLSGEMTSVFDNGLPLGRTDWVADGVLTSLLQTRHSAGLTGQPVTPYVDNLVLEVDGSAGGIDEVVAGVERGLLLTCLWYIREVDPQSMLLTGLTRDGVYLVEGGEITGVVNNFRWNESPVDLLTRFSHASASVPSFSREWGDDYFSRTITPALRIPDFNMSSVSQAL